ncbi:MAG: radical SAM protein [Acidaminococcales bacterium]|jgi:pyruvate-formate lyase-activating enzyme|nr:radical SAM protein [Acidaminococcales bacterium]
MKEIIFYGAGGFARANYTQWIAQGLKPVCFADADTQKHHSYFVCADGDTMLQVVPLAEAINRYPDYTLYVTVDPNNLLPVTDFLLAWGIPSYRIKYPGPYERRKGCSWLGGAPASFLAYTGDRICTCCYVDREFLKRAETIEQDIINAQKFIGNRINDLRNDRPTPCDKCPNLVDGIFLQNPKIDRIGINSYLDKTVCNFRCVYCGVEEAFHKTKDGLETPLELTRKIHKAVENANPAIALSLSAGEITVSSWCDEVLEFIKEKHWATRLLTNGYIYKEKITELMQEGIITTVCVSLDAGTKQTFAKVKAVDGWYKVIGNLEKYAVVHGALQLKYIMLRGINDNKEDILGFIGLCARLNTDAMLSKDVFADRKLSQSELDSSLLFIKEAKRLNVRVLLLSEFFYNISDRQVLEKALQSE